MKSFQRLFMPWIDPYCNQILLCTTTILLYSIIEICIIGLVGHGVFAIVVDRELAKRRGEGWFSCGLKGEWRLNQRNRTTPVRFFPGCLFLLLCFYILRKTCIPRYDIGNFIVWYSIAVHTDWSFSWVSHSKSACFVDARLLSPFSLGDDGFVLLLEL